MNDLSLSYRLSSQSQAFSMNHYPIKLSSQSSAAIHTENQVNKSLGLYKASIYLHTQAELSEDYCPTPCKLMSGFVFSDCERAVQHQRPSQVQGLQLHVPHLL